MEDNREKVDLIIQPEIARPWVTRR
jgi:hypothetical protein